MAYQSDKQELITGRLFPTHNPGPYVVFVEPTEGNFGNLHPISRGWKLHPNKEVLYIQRAGPNRLKITFATGFIVSGLPTTLKLKTYIPKSLLYRQVIIYEVPLDYTIKDIQEGIECPNFQAIEIIHMTKLIRECDNTEQVSIKLLTLTVAGQVLPCKVIILKEIFEVSPKVQTVVKCYNCYRFGHTTKLCRSKDPRWPYCAQTHNKTMCLNGWFCYKALSPITSITPFQPYK
ncbi:hypothetical protein PR048_016951 [Dryococelus australis]|uniref:CCHC-type domain-containing protein n=1 Tax=Dryococelus australis TaxID=614101 RepID=A0ABQ9H885_9NEOP|nr:hypothetical protein PR048_016951 [Dryococelus australis]